MQRVKMNPDRAAAIAIVNDWFDREVPGEIQIRTGRNGILLIVSESNRNTGETWHRYDRRRGGRVDILIHKKTLA